MVATSPVNPDPRQQHQHSFAQISQLPSPTIKRDALCIKITQLEYEKGLADCKNNLHGRLVLNKGDKPVTVHELCAKLIPSWKTSAPWKMVLLGRGIYDFQFVSYEDMDLWISLEDGFIYDLPRRWFY
jgi:hypothetical protein